MKKNNGTNKVDNWTELFDMTFEYLTFLLEAEDIKPDMVIKTTRDILVNAGYEYTFDEVEEEYHNCL